MSVRKNIRTDSKIKNSIEKHFHKPDFKPEDMRPLKEWINKNPKCNNWENKFPSREDTPEYEEELMQFYRLEEKLDLIHRGVEMQLMNPLFRPPSMMDLRKHPLLKKLK